MSLKRIHRGIRRNSLPFVGILIISLLALMGILAPWIAPYDPSDRVAAPYTPPCREHLVGG